MLRTTPTHDRARALVLAACVLAACAEARERQQPAPVYEADVAELLLERCAGCHGAGDAGGGYRVDGYLETLSCTSSAPATPAVGVADGDAGTPLLDVLDRPDHEGLLSAQERARVAAWIERGAPLRDRGVHASGVLDPRSSDWHGRLAARDRFARVVDADHPEACGRCHAGAPAAPPGASPADGAPACTSCHDRPAGVLACGTCHGDGAQRAHPPRDACAFPGPGADAHAAHVRAGPLLAEGLACSACHPAATAELSGMHADGVVDLQLDPSVAGEDARFDASRDRCAVSCHDRGGARAQPSWHEPGPMRCGDCHGAPPAEHYAGACDACHADVDAEGTALSPGARHLDGEVVLGPRDARGEGCGACHGQGSDPMPDTASHALHRAPVVSSEIACVECHELPDTVTSEGHLDRGERSAADVSFGALARARGREPSYDPATRVCRDVACHGAGLGDGIERALAWDERAGTSCGGCHGLPPAAPHPRQTSCAALACHGTEVTAGSTPRLTDAGRRLHVNGEIDHGTP